jgi:hypothetical protein
MFAEDYPRFMEVSDLTPQPDRLNERYEAMFAGNKDILDGARVLDLASHDGRYSFAALKAGAAHVTGVEVRQELIDKAEETFAFYGQDPETYRFVCGDIFEVLAEQKFDVDVVFCLGYLYHTYRHTELMYRLHHLDAKYLIVDTMVTPDTEASCKVVREPDAQDIRSAAQDPWAVDRVLVLRPSVPALQILLRNYGFDIESMYDWKSRLAGREIKPGLGGYAKGQRATVRCRYRKAATEAGLEPLPPIKLPSGPKGPATEPAPVEPTGGWRDRVNRTLAKATGYELRRVPGGR